MTRIAMGRRLIQVTIVSFKQVTERSRDHNIRRTRPILRVDCRRIACARRGRTIVFLPCESGELNFTLATVSRGSYIAENFGGMGDGESAALYCPEKAEKPELRFSRVV